MHAGDSLTVQTNVPGPYSQHHPLLPKRVCLCNLKIKLLRNVLHSKSATKQDWTNNRRAPGAWLGFLDIQWQSVHFKVEIELSHPITEQPSRSFHQPLLYGGQHCVRATLCGCFIVKEVAVFLDAKEESNCIAPLYCLFCCLIVSNRHYIIL